MHETPDVALQRFCEMNVNAISGDDLGELTQELIDIGRAEELQRLKEF